MSCPKVIDIDGFSQGVSADVILEGISISSIAERVSEDHSAGPSLSREDILRTFGLSDGAYTIGNHFSLMLKIQSECNPYFSLVDSLPPSILGKKLLKPADISPRTACILEENGIPLSMPSFELALGNITSTNVSDAEENNLNIWSGYLWWGLQIESRGAQIGGLVSAFYLIMGLLVDGYKVRVEKIKEHFEAKGCSDIERDRECVEKASAMSKDEATIFLEMPICKTFKEDLFCYHRGMIDDIENFGSSPQQRHADNTRTTFMRSVFLGKAISKASDHFPKPVEKVLIVGPGLDYTPTWFGSYAPMPQTYEPFAVVDSAIAYLGADIKGLQVDLVDISQEVINHLNDAKKWSFYQLWLSSPKSGSDKKMKFAEHIPGVQVKNYDTDEEYKRAVVLPRDALKNLNPTLGDIITDRIGEDGSYDMVVMMNTFRYFDEKGTSLALDNIARLLKTGGILVTDIYENVGSLSKRCNGLATAAIHQSKDIMAFPYQYSFSETDIPEVKIIIFWQKGR